MTVLVSTCYYPVFYIVILYGEINGFESRHWVRSTKKKKKNNVNVIKNIVAVQRVTRKLLYLAHGSDAHGVRIVSSSTVVGFVPLLLTELLQLSDIYRLSSINCTFQLKLVFDLAIPKLKFSCFSTIRRLTMF